MATSTTDRPPVHGAGLLLPSTLDGLVAERLRTPERDAALLIELREWAKKALGSVDALAGLVADRAKCTHSNARMCLYQVRSQPVIAAAVAIYREHVAAESPTVAA